MKRYLLIGLVCGTLALAGGVALAGPSFERSATVAAQATPAPTAQPEAPNPRSNRGPRQGDAQHSGRGKGQKLGMLLGRATADVAGITQRDVLAGLNDGKSLAQIVSGDRISVEQHDWNREVMAPKNRALIARAREAGVLRDDVTGTDLTFIQVGLNAIMTRSRHAHPNLQACFGRRADWTRSLSVQ